MTNSHKVLDQVFAEIKVKQRTDQASVRTWEPVVKQRTDQASVRTWEPVVRKKTSQSMTEYLVVARTLEPSDDECYLKKKVNLSDNGLSTLVAMGNWMMMMTRKVKTC